MKSDLAKNQFLDFAFVSFCSKSIRECKNQRKKVQTKKRRSGFEPQPFFLISIFHTTVNDNPCAILGKPCGWSHILCFLTLSHRRQLRVISCKMSQAVSDDRIDFGTFCFSKTNRPGENTRYCLHSSRIIALIVLICGFEFFERKPFEWFRI